MLRPQVACPSHVSSQHHVSMRCCEYFTEATDNIRTASSRANAREKWQQPQGLSKRYDSGATAVPIGTLPWQHARSAGRFSDNHRVALLWGARPVQGCLLTLQTTFAASSDGTQGCVLASHILCGAEQKYLHADPVAAVRTSAICASSMAGNPLIHGHAQSAEPHRRNTAINGFQACPFVLLKHQSLPSTALSDTLLGGESGCQPNNMHHVAQPTRRVSYTRASWTVHRSSACGAALWVCTAGSWKLIEHVWLYCSVQICRILSSRRGPDQSTSMRRV